MYQCLSKGNSGNFLSHQWLRTRHCDSARDTSASDYQGGRTAIPWELTENAAPTLRSRSLRPSVNVSFDLALMGFSHRSSSETYTSPGNPWHHVMCPELCGTRDTSKDPVKVTQALGPSCENRKYRQRLGRINIWKGAI